jgi:hypothetical protein
MQHLNVVLWLIAFGSLGGFSLALSLTMDILNLLFFHIKMTFGFINLLFTEHMAWLRILWRTFCATRFNAGEQRLQEQYFAPHVRYAAMLCAVLLFCLVPTVSFYWLWSAMLLVLAHVLTVTSIHQTALESLLTAVCHLPLGSLLASSLFAKVTLKALHVKPVSKLHEFRLLRRSTANTWLLKRLLAELGSMKNLQAVTNAILAKPGAVGFTHLDGRSDFPCEEIMSISYL